jgi:hypothetical protein
VRAETSDECGGLGDTVGGRLVVEDAHEQESSVQFVRGIQVSVGGKGRDLQREAGGLL